jgi:nucleoside-diphosphate-sugar epimerase
MSPLIYGTGSGGFKKASTQIPYLMKIALDEGQPVVIEDGAGVWDYVHIADLAILYEILLDKAISGEDIPSGKRGIYFSGTGRFSWRELSELVGKAGVEIGALKSAEPKKVTLEFVSEKIGWPPQQVERALASK